jgi:hypothetical protein
MPAVILLSLTSSVASAIGEAVPSSERLQIGTSAWTYDFSAARVAAIKAFNAKVPAGRMFRSLFPYAGSVEVNGVSRTVTVAYSRGTVTAYVEALGPGIRMLPIVDGRQDQGEFNNWSATEYEAAAILVADRILGDADAAGVQIDIEPFKPSHAPFYAALGKRLRAAGKLTTGFMGPGQPPETLKAMYQACDVVVIAGYDFALETPAAYQKALAAALGRVHAIAKSVGGHSLLGIPASASWGEHEYHGEIQDGKCLRKDSGFKQTEWLTAALAAYAEHEQDSTLVGLALWQLAEPPTATPPACQRGDHPDFISAEAWSLLSVSAHK